MLADGQPYRPVQDAVGCFPSYASRWRERFLRDGIAGMGSGCRGQSPRIMTLHLEARILDRTGRRRPAGSAHWSIHKLAKVLGVDHMMVARAWARAGLKPYRFRRYMASTDPELETKAADIIGFHLNPARHADVLLVFDEKAAIQALDHLQPVVPLSRGRAKLHAFGYYPPGTLLLVATLNSRTGETVGRAVSCHTSAGFADFLTEVVATQPRRKEIQVFLDDLSTHKTQTVARFSGAHPNEYLHFTPTYESWRNQIELWYSKMERDPITPGGFRSVRNLRRTIMHYIRHRNRAAQPIFWVHRHPDRRIISTTPWVGTALCPAAIRSCNVPHIRLLIQLVHRGPSFGTW